MRKRSTIRRGTRCKAQRGRRRKITRNVRSTRVGGRDRNPWSKSPSSKSQSKRHTPTPQNVHYITYNKFQSYFTPANLDDNKLKKLSVLYNDSTNFSDFSNKITNEFNVHHSNHHSKYEYVNLKRGDENKLFKCDTFGSCNEKKYDKIKLGVEPRFYNI